MKSPAMKANLTPMVLMWFPTKGVTRKAVRQFTPEIYKDASGLAHLPKLFGNLNLICLSSFFSQDSHTNYSFTFQRESMGFP